jgi:hypothetical protein
MTGNVSVRIMVQGAVQKVRPYLKIAITKRQEAWLKQ